VDYGWAVRFLSVVCRSCLLSAHCRPIYLTFLEGPAFSDPAFQILIYSPSFLRRAFSGPEFSAPPPLTPITSPDRNNPNRTTLDSNSMTLSLPLHQPGADVR